MMARWHRSADVSAHTKHRGCGTWCNRSVRRSPPLSVKLRYLVCQSSKPRKRFPSSTKERYWMPARLSKPSIPLSGDYEQVVRQALMRLGKNLGLGIECRDSLLYEGETGHPAPVLSVFRCAASLAGQPPVAGWSGSVGRAGRAGGGYSCALLLARRADIRNITRKWSVE